jgi:hypothetical protein
MKFRTREGSKFRAQITGRDLRAKREAESLVLDVTLAQHGTGGRQGTTAWKPELEELTAWLEENSIESEAGTICHLPETGLSFEVVYSWDTAVVLRIGLAEKACPVLMRTAGPWSRFDFPIPRCQLAGAAVSLRKQLAYHNRRRDGSIMGD